MVEGLAEAGPHVAAIVGSDKGAREADRPVFHTSISTIVLQTNKGTIGVLACAKLAIIERT
eukprot:scaffold151681_cov47-Prasinocladus_malaysianus.AAC.1